MYHQIQLSSKLSFSVTCVVAALLQTGHFRSSSHPHHARPLQYWSEVEHGESRMEASLSTTTHSGTRIKDRTQPVTRFRRAFRRLWE